MVVEIYFHAGLWERGKDFIELNEWQIQEIKETVKEPYNGDCASNKDVKKPFVK